MKTTVFACLESRLETNNQFYGLFKLGPFALNQALTVANAIRRTALDCGLGTSILAVQIYGAQHEYISLKGVRECVFDILSNLRCVALQSHTTQRQTCVAHVNFIGPATLRAGDLLLPQSIKCVNPNQILATLEVNGQLRLKIFLVPSSSMLFKNRTVASIIRAYEHRWFRNNSIKSKNRVKKNLLTRSLKTPNLSNFLFIGHPQSSIIRINYGVDQNYRNSGEFVILEVWTNGSCHPRTVIQKSIQTLLAFLIPFYPTHLSNKPRDLKGILKRPARRIFDRRFFSLDIDNLNLPFSIWQFFKARKLSTLRDIWVYLNTRPQPAPDEIYYILNQALSRYGLKLRTERFHATSLDVDQ